MSRNFALLFVIGIALGQLPAQFGTHAVTVACACAPTDLACLLTNCSGIGSKNGTGGRGTNARMRDEEVVKPRNAMQPLDRKASGSRINP